jgi:hypothetical protein
MHLSLNGFYRLCRFALPVSVVLAMLLAAILAVGDVYYLTIDTTGMREKHYNTHGEILAIHDQYKLKLKGYKQIDKLSEIRTTMHDGTLWQMHLVVSHTDHWQATSFREFPCQTASRMRLRQSRSILSDFHQKSMPVLTNTTVISQRHMACYSRIWSLAFWPFCLLCILAILFPRM